MLVSLGKSTASYRINPLTQNKIVPFFSPRLEGDARVPGEVHGVVPNKSANTKLNCSILLPGPRLEGDAGVPGEVHGVVSNESANAKLNCSILSPHSACNLTS